MLSIPSPKTFIHSQLHTKFLGVLRYLLGIKVLTSKDSFTKEKYENKKIGSNISEKMVPDQGGNGSTFPHQ